MYPAIIDEYLVSILLLLETTLHRKSLHICVNIYISYAFILVIP